MILTGIEQNSRPSTEHGRFRIQQAGMDSGGASGPYLGPCHSARKPKK